MTIDYALNTVTKQTIKTGLRLDPLQKITAAHMLQKGEKTRVYVTVAGLNRKTNQYQY